MELRDILTRLKTENGLTTEMLSVRSGVPKGTLNKLLNGETRNPTGGTLKKIADALNCPVQALYSGAAFLREDESDYSYSSVGPFPCWAKSRRVRRFTPIKPQTWYPAAKVFTAILRCACVATA